MKALLTTLCLLFYLNHHAQASSIITSDIDNFWAAYDRIKAATDSVEQYAYINTLFIDKGTPGLKAMQQARRYTDASYINAIKNYPKFWESVRPNTLKSTAIASEIDKGIANLKKLYPELKPAKIYFTVGALRSNGTTLNGMVLIGSELAMADEHTVSSEFGEAYSHLPGFFKGNPINGIVFLTVHEYVHTQQKTTVGNNLLTQCVIEGVAEFMAVKAMNIPSPTAAISFGLKNSKKVREKFEKDMFNPLKFYDWLWGSGENDFNTRDLGYYTGYTICEKYYNKATDKKKALQEMLELDYNNADTLEKFIDKSGYFEKPVKSYEADFEKSRPIVKNVIFNGSATAKPGPARITVEFSETMNRNYRNFELGPLGAENVLRFDNATFSADGRSMTFEANLESGKHYQLELGDQFRSAGNMPLKPFLIDFTTASN